MKGISEYFPSVMIQHSQSQFICVERSSRRRLDRYADLNYLRLVGGEYSVGGIKNRHLQRCRRPFPLGTYRRPRILNKVVAG